MMLSGPGLQRTAPVFLSSCLYLLICWSGTISGDVPEGVTVYVLEGRDVLLPCSIPNENLVSKLFDWRKKNGGDQKKEVFLYERGLHYNNGHGGQDLQFRGRVSHCEDELKNGNASIIIRNTTRADTGDYTCFFPHLQPNRLFHIKLVVELVLRERSGETGAAPEPCMKILNATEDGVLLQCQVRGATPKPKVEFQDSTGKAVPGQEEKVSNNGDLYSITVLAKVNKTDRFRCVATQEEIGHQISAETFVPFFEKQREDRSTKEITGWVGGLVCGLACGLVGGLVLGAVILAVLKVTKTIVLRINKGGRQPKLSYCRGSTTGSPTGSPTESPTDSSSGSSSDSKKPLKSPA